MIRCDGRGGNSIELCWRDRGVKFGYRGQLTSSVITQVNLGNLVGVRIGALQKSDHEPLPALLDACFDVGQLA